MAIIIDFGKCSFGGMIGKCMIGEDSRDMSWRKIEDSKYIQLFQKVFLQRRTRG